MSASAQWSDLTPRILSGLVLAVLGGFAVWLGGFWFLVLACLVGGLMGWEAARMFSARQAVGLGFLAAGVLALTMVLPWVFALPLLVAAGFVAAGQTDRDGPVLFGVFAWIMFGTFALLILRSEMGVGWILWLVLVVVASDVAGYFAGRALGGPKFWPSISPKKTWSGTLAGWLGAALIGALCAVPLAAGGGLVLISILVGFAGQMGDIAQSAIKRRQGIKDSSDLIPGHGGVFDRFDAMLGAAVLTLLLWALGVLQGGAG